MTSQLEMTCLSQKSAIGCEEMRERSKWRAWRIYCPDWKSVAKALAHFAGPLLEDMENKGLIDSWYVSRKSEGVPTTISFRLYVRFLVENQERVVKLIENAYSSNKEQFNFGIIKDEADVLKGEDKAEKLKHASRLAISLLHENRETSVTREDITKIFKELRRGGHLDRQSRHFVTNILGLPG